MALTPTLIDYILIGIAVEFAVLALWLWSTARDEWIAPLAVFLASGAAMMLAVRFTLSDTPTLFVQAALAGAGIAHIATLILAWQAARD